VDRILTPENLRREIDDSLRRLGVDYVDLYQTHWQVEDTPIAETMGALLEIQQQGKIRAIGVSNASTEQMDQYLAVGRIESTQPRYNMLDRRIEKDYLPYCLRHNLGVLTYSSLSLGLLTGKISPDRRFPDNDLRANNPLFKPEKIEAVNAMLDKFAPFREKYGLNQAQLAIAWTISRPGVTVALVGVRNPEQAADVAPGGGVQITPEDLAAMDRIIDGL
jgi:aryl-alcohol dehydrogenase-like predicted oxidoreductase